MSVLSVGFDDFKSLAKNHRIYYYEGETYVDFHFLFDGGIVKTTVRKEEIKNIKRFVSDPMFYGAMKLDFNIPTPMPNSISILKDAKRTGIDIRDKQDEEVKNIDIQIEGVNDGRADS